MNKKFWFYLEPFTFIFPQKDQTLLYNSVSFKGKLFKTNDKLREIICQLKDMKNMYCIKLTENNVQIKEIEEFVNFARKSFSGDLIDSDKIRKPAIFPPVLNLQYNINALKGTSARNLGEQIFSLLNEVSLYLGGNDPSSNLNNVPVFKQFDYCKRTDAKYLPFPKLKKLLESLEESYLQNINIIGGNLFTYPDFDILVDDLCKLPFNKCIYSACCDIPENLGKYLFLKDPNFNLKVLIDFPLKPQILDKVINELTKNNCKFECLFAVTSMSEFGLAEGIITKYALEQYEIKPVFTGENMSFFEDNIYLKEKDIFKTNITRKDIFINQSLNIFNFGKLRIMDDGKVYSDFNRPSIGNIDHSLIAMLHKEMSKPNSWLRVRNKKPCNRCVYRWLCPSPSGYEHVIGKQNLCTVKS